MNTIIFLLIITLYQPDVMVISGYGTSLDTREKIIVLSPESAAVVMWQKNRFTGFNSSYSGELYRIDLEKGTVEKVKIPVVKFMEGEAMTPQRRVNDGVKAMLVISAILFVAAIVLTARWWLM